MSNVQSYNALIDRFKAFAAGHFILKRFSHGQIEVSDLEKFGEYPFMHVIPSNVTYSQGMKTFSFQIVLADLPRDKEDKTEYQREVLSDLQRIAEDLIAEITNHRVLFGDLITVQNVSLEPFLEEFQHTLTGWTISLDLLVPYYWDACSIPAEWNDFFESSTGGTGSILTFIDSITRDENGNVSLVNDEANPAPHYYYGTNDEGVRGWYLLTDEVGLTCVTLPSCQTIIDIEAAIDLLQQDIVDLNADLALKANTADISAVGFSNDYNDLDNKPTIPTSLPPTGTAGGDLTGTYPDPTVHRVHGIDLQSGTPSTDDVWVYGGSPAKWQHQHLNASQVDNDSSVTGTTTKLALEHLDSSKQATLVSGTNIKTLEGQSLLGSGNIDLTKSDVGLGNVDNTSDLNKPISTATQTALNAKQDSLGYTPVPTTRSITINGTTQDLSANRTFTIASNPGTVTSVAALTLGTTGTDLSSTVANSTSTPVITLNVPTASATNRGVLSAADWSTFNGKQAALVSGTNIKTINSTSLLGSGNVAVEPTITAGTTGQYYRGDKTFQTLDKTAVGLGNVDNTSDANKPVSTATQTALNLKEDSANKQNSLAVDGTGVKFPTVDAVNNLSFIDKGKRIVSVFSDFIGNVTTIDGLASYTSGSIMGNIGSGIPNRTNQQGVQYYNTLTGATNYALHASASTATMWLGGGTWVYETSINIANLSVLTDRYRFVSGFGSGNGAATETDGVFLTYDEGGTLNGTAASPNWQCVTVANSVRTLTTTSTAVTAGAWHKLRIEINAAGTSASFYLNGTLLATHTTNIPLGSATRFVLVKQGMFKTIGLTNRVIYTDYLGYENILTTPRT